MLPTIRMSAKASPSILVKTAELNRFTGKLNQTVVELNHVAQDNYYKWSSGKSGSMSTLLLNRVTSKCLDMVGQHDISNRYKENIRENVMAALWQLGRQQVNVLSPMKSLLDSGQITNPLPLVVMEYAFASDMLEIMRGKKSDAVWDDKILNVMSTFPGLNLIYAGKKLHVDYDFPKAIKYAKEVTGEYPDVEAWSKGFAPVIVGTRQTQNEMLENFPINSFALGTRLPLAMEQFFFMRNQPFDKIHEPGTVYTYPDQSLIEICAQNPPLPFDYDPSTKPPDFGITSEEQAQNEGQAEQENEGE